MERIQCGLLVFVAMLVGRSEMYGIEEYCLGDDRNPYLYYASKTSYQFVYDHSLKPHTIPNCKPMQVWLLSRHGTRYPQADEIERLSKMGVLRDQIVKNHQQPYKSGELCYKDVEGLRAWSWKLKPEDENKLTPQGWNEMFFLAKRMKTNFPDLLDTDYSPEKFIVKFAESRRCHESTRAFVEGLFGKDSQVQVPDSFQDDILSPEMNCTKWKEKEESPDVKREQELFVNGPIMDQLVRTVSQRIGFSYNLSIDMVNDMYDLCRYEKAWNNTAISPWCAVFQKEDLQILEYAQDLKYYYGSGYGNDLTFKLGCQLVRDLMENFRKVANNETDTPRGVLYFVHSLALRSFITTMGIAPDVLAPTHSNFQSMSKRQWRTSFISPFAGNLAAVIYKCWEGEENKILLYLGEREIDYEGCKVGLCSWNYLWDKFKNVVDPANCNKQFCHHLSNGTPGIPSISLPSIMYSLLILLVMNFR